MKCGRSAKFEALPKADRMQQYKRDDKTGLVTRSALFQVTYSLLAPPPFLAPPLPPPLLSFSPLFLSPSPSPLLLTSLPLLSQVTVSVVDVEERRRLLALVDTDEWSSVILSVLGTTSVNSLDGTVSAAAVQLKRTRTRHTSWTDSPDGSSDGSPDGADVE
jgi:hypothetical protein